MFKRLFIIGFFVLLGCFSKESQPITGYYRSPDNTYLNKIRYGKFVTDLTMEINKDGTYVFSTCTQTEKGRWIKMFWNFIVKKRNSLMIVLII
ncbi:hypothetical protein [Chryseobacterium sp.]|uniref:hypothetical protein n=1 Tax=Chryseobacterium sp. TaxID=1871047 RepID=UPI0011CC35D2|nr:hypothetical protein [Chryseobacterium sp.]TXF77390.1 hypothetical protein FUA25_05510 [Chryseobacterium sp.]